MKRIDQVFALDPAGVDQMAETIQTYLEAGGLARKEALRSRMTVETMLLRLLAWPDRPETARLILRKGFQNYVVLLRYSGGAFDLTEAAEGEEAWSGALLERLGLAPSWNCRRGQNTLRLRILRPSGSRRLLHLAIAVLLAAALGAAGTMLPEALRTSLINTILTPVFDAFLGLINTFAGPMIFLTVAAGIFGIGDTAALSRIGKVMFSRYLIAAFLVGAMTMAVTRPFLSLTMGGSSGESQGRQLSEMLFGILSKNPIQPFLDSNTLQIIVLGAFFGVVLLLLGGRANHVRAFVEEGAVVVQVMMELVCRLIPLFVFVSLLRQIWSGAAGQLLQLWKPFLLFLLAAAVFLVIQIAGVVLRTRTSPLLLLRKTAPATVVAFTTASSMASYATSQEACEKSLGIRHDLFSFAFPMGIVTFMPSAVVTFSVLAVYFAEFYKVPVNPAWFVLAVILSAFLSVAVPPTPGAMLTCYGILLLQLGLPADAMLLAVALDVVLDFFMTGVNVLALQLELTSQAKILKMLDEDILHAKAPQAK